MEECSGDDLLRVFEKLNINIGNLSPNNVKAWFDTDCPNMLNLLNWLCTSLNEDNYVSPQEQNEFSKLPVILEGEKLAKEIEEIENKYPSLFDVEENSIETELTNDKIDVCLDQNKILEKSYTINKNLQRSLCQELNLLSSHEIKTSLARENAHQECLNLAKELDACNVDLYERISNYQNYLFKFNNDNDCIFISNYQIEELEHGFGHLVELINMKYRNSNNKTSLLDITISEQIDEDVRKRILQCYKRLSKNKIEKETLLVVLNYLDNYDVNSMLTFVDYQSLLNSVEIKSEQKRLLLGMLDGHITKVVNNDVFLSKSKSLNKELTKLQSKLNNITQIYDLVLSIFTHFAVINYLYLQEKKDLYETDHFFRLVLAYINKDLRAINDRFINMQEVIEQHQQFKLKSPIEQNKCLMIASKILGIENDSLNSIIKQVNQLKFGMINYKQQLYNVDVKFHFTVVKELAKKNRMLENFLINGPTNCVVIIPQKINSLLYELDELIKGQESSLKAAIQNSSNAWKKLSSEKWFCIRRQLWMYFIEDPPKMLSFIEQIEEFYNAQKKKNHFS